MRQVTNLPGHPELTSIQAERESAKPRREPMSVPSRFQESAERPTYVL